jgi:hypothetical protein
MSRHTKRSSDTGFAALTIEGGLIAPDQVQAITSAAPDQKTAAEYGCPKGTGLRDEITRYFRIAQAHWQGHARLEQPTMQQTAEFARNLLEQAFGFELTGPHHHMREDRRFTIAWEAKGGRVPIVIAPPAPANKGKAGDGFARALPEFGDGADGRIARRSPTVLLQDWLNANPDFYWGLVFAGDRVRLMRDNASLTRPAWIEADLGAIFRDEMFADFAALWLLIHASRFGAEGTAASDCALERWREAGMRAGTSARERLRVNVQEALMALGQGILDANPAIRERLDTSQLTMHLFEQMLRVVYRLIFLGVAEDRDLLHPPATPKAVRDLYSNNYGFAWARDRSTRRNAHDHHHDAWEGVKVTFRALERGEKLLGLPALGGLFDRALTPDLDAAQIPNRALLAAAFKLGWLIEDGRRVRINWRDMATEELGSVYEGLLELVPVRENEGRTFSFAGGAEARGNARKVSGSYYTPDSLVQCLLDSALDPVLERAEAEGGAEAILELNVIDPACGSGHFLLGAARRMATRVAQLRNPDAPDYNAAMRDVVRNCIHGVDRNPMAIELAKVALWIESVEPGKPLGFLDANIQCGDSLLGVFDLKALDDGIPDDAYKPLTGDDKDTAKYFAKRNRDEKKGQGTLDFIGGGGTLPPASLAAAMDDLRLLPEDTLAQVAEKRRRFTQWETDPKRYAKKVACDLYIAAFVLPKTGGAPTNANSVMVPTTSHLRNRLGGGQVYGPVEAAAVDAAEYARAFHWPLAFPEVMIGKGGFDVVLGNPPWERIEVQEQEFFSSSYPAIAGAKNAAKRRAMIEALEIDDPATFVEWRLALRAAAVEVSFYKGSGRFPFGSVGKINTYAVFADHFRQLITKSGRAALILQTGLVDGFTYRKFLSHLLQTKTIVSYFGFENEELLFPHITNKMKFGIITLSGGDVLNDQPWFTANLRQPAQIEDSNRRYALSIDEIQAINPNTLNLPAFRWAKDAEVTAAIHRAAPVLIRKTADGNEHNPWEVSLKSLFNMATDSVHFLDHEEISEKVVERRGALAVLSDGREVYPLYEGKMFWHFDHRYGTYEGQTEKQANKGVLPRVSVTAHSDPNYQIQSQYWVEKNLVEEALGDSDHKNWLFSWRDVGPSERTMVGAIIPFTATGDKAPIMTSTLPASDIICLAGILSSLVVDYCARQKSTDMKFFIVEQIAVLSPSILDEENTWMGSTVREWIRDRTFELSYTNYELASLAADLGFGHGPFHWDSERRAYLKAEIDAAILHLYEINRAQADWLIDSFSVLRKYEERDHNEFRTKRLVLEIYDEMARARASGKAYQTRLSPPPADPSCCHAEPVDFAAPDELFAVPLDTHHVGNGSWEYAIRDEADVRLLLAAILQRMGQPRSSSEVRWAFLYAAQPHLLMPHLNVHEQTEWRRLVGVAATLPVSQLVPTFSSTQLAHFGTAQAMLAARNAWRYDVQSDLVDHGAAIYDIVLSPWAEGRASFVWEALRSIDLSSPTVTAALSQGEQSFVAQSAAA